MAERIHRARADALAPAVAETARGGHATVRYSFFEEKTRFILVPGVAWCNQEKWEESISYFF
jgi:hypothetical protein